MKSLILVSLMVYAFSISTMVEAKCRKAHVCDDYGQNCKMRQICDSQLDLPSIEVTPIKPLPSTNLKPLPSVKLAATRNDKVPV